jgi:hypothetical protein
VLVGALACATLAAGLHWVYARRDRDPRARRFVAAVMTKSLTGVTYPAWGLLLLALALDFVALRLLAQWLGWLPQELLEVRPR